MQRGSVTTPFGRRPMTLALVKGQQATTEIKVGKTVEKWKVFRDASEARERLGLHDRSLTLLDALLTFYPENELRQDAQLIVFPSNAQLTLRAHGITGATMRRHLAVLVDSGLIIRRDSANGKRYSRKDDQGAIESAYGFDLSPLLARSEELAAMAQEVAAARATFRRRKEALTICRRDVRKLISAAMEEGAEGDWQGVEAVYVSIVARIPRHPTLGDVTARLDEMELLREEILNRLELQAKTQITSTNDVQNERHKQNSKPESSNELELRSEDRKKAAPDDKPMRLAEPLKSFPLAIVLKACPQISDYGPGGTIGSWRDLMSAAVVVRSMLAVSPSAYQNACEVMGQENAAVAMACILERANVINSAGGYLRDLTRRTARGEFSLGPMVMALLNVGSSDRARAG